MSMRALGAAILLLAACSGERAPAPPVADTVPVSAAPEVTDSAMALVAPAAAIALALEEHPDRADSILQAAGMTPEQFESLMYRIAADSTARMLFESARLN